MQLKRDTYGTLLIHSVRCTTKQVLFRVNR